MLLYLGYNATKIDAKERKHSIATYFLVIVISSGISIFSKKKKKKAFGWILITDTAQSWYTKRVELIFLE